ncbi:replication initiation protein RepM [Comamonas jiangduensis]|jgi:plasmid replication initiation protein|uniref:replication initiation protein RepM n=1 Tax=Comamonas jiangduensis TaxID=1194168 RepID=UPI003BF7913A
MKNELVVKDNALINASYNLETAEQRLIMLAVINARETGQGITADSKLEIHASDYAKHFNVSTDAAYKVMKEAVNNLFERKFSYVAEYKKTGKTGVVRSRWVSRIFYVDSLAILEITFAPDVVPLVTRLEEHFTSYQLKQVSNLTSKYAIRLYELLIAWREVGKTPQIELSEFRQKIGVENGEYERMHHFKARVLEPAIKQINEHTDITASYEQHKRGRTISGFSFRFKQKQQVKKIESKRDPNTPDFFIKMTDAQRHLFAKKMSEMPEMSSYSQGTESYQQFAIRIADMLLQPEKFRELYPILEKAGFK